MTTVSWPGSLRMWTAIVAAIGGCWLQELVCWRRVGNRRIARNRNPGDCVYAPFMSIKAFHDSFKPVIPKSRSIKVHKYTACASTPIGSHISTLASTIICDGNLHHLHHPSIQQHIPPSCPIPRPPPTAPPSPQYPNHPPPNPSIPPITPGHRPSASCSAA